MQTTAGLSELDEPLRAAIEGAEGEGASVEAVLICVRSARVRLERLARQVESGERPLPTTSGAFAGSEGTQP